MPSMIGALYIWIAPCIDSGFSVDVMAVSAPNPRASMFSDARWLLQVARTETQHRGETQTEANEAAYAQAIQVVRSYSPMSVMPHAW